MRKQFLTQLTHNGETLTISEWAGRKGIKPHTIQTRLDRGYSVENAIEIPIVKPPSKSDAEMELNDMAFPNLPVVVQKTIKASNVITKRYGTWFRTNHRKSFDSWFKTHYLVKEVKRVPCFTGMEKSIFIPA